MKAKVRRIKDKWRIVMAGNQSELLLDKEGKPIDEGGYYTRDDADRMAGNWDRRLEKDMKIPESKLCSDCGCTYKGDMCSCQQEKDLKICPECLIPTKGNNCPKCLKLIPVIPDPYTPDSCTQCSKEYEAEDDDTLGLCGVCYEWFNQGGKLRVKCQNPDCRNHILAYSGEDHYCTTCQPKTIGHQNFICKNCDKMYYSISKQRDYCEKCWEVIKMKYQWHCEDCNRYMAIDDSNPVIPNCGKCGKPMQASPLPIVDLGIKDTGEHHEFDTGAKRDDRSGKGRYDLISPIFLKRLAVHLEKGAAKYEERNWEKGIPLSRSLDSLIRHARQFQEGLRDEDHLAAIACNIMFIIHTKEMVDRGILDASLNDLPDYDIPMHKSIKKYREVKKREALLEA